MVIEISTEVNLHIYDEEDYSQGDPLPPLEKKALDITDLFEEATASNEEGPLFTMGDNPLPITIKFNTKDLVYYSAKYPDGGENVVLLITSSIFHLKMPIEDFEKMLLQKLSDHKEIHEEMGLVDTDWYLFLSSKYEINE